MRQAPNMQHGHAGKGGVSRTYRAWVCMIARCYNPKNANYARYGGKGVVVCERWRGELRPGKKNRHGGFAAFLSEMGECPYPDGQLHRIENARPYERGNCQWLSRSDHTWLTGRIRHARKVGII